MTKEIRSEINPAVQPQKMTRGLGVEEVYCLRRENKDADQLHGPATLVFAYA